MHFNFFIPEDGDGVSCRNVEKLHILTRLSARENLIEVGVKFYMLLSSYLCSWARGGVVG
jgi:hypothetical protein